MVWFVEFFHGFVNYIVDTSGRYIVSVYVCVYVIARCLSRAENEYGIVFSWIWYIMCLVKKSWVREALAEVTKRAKFLWIYTYEYSIERKKKTNEATSVSD